METSGVLSFLFDYARFSLKNAVFNAQLGEGLDLTVHCDYLVFFVQFGLYIKLTLL